MMKILIFTKNWIGDTLFQIPAIEMIRRRYPGSEIVCAAPERCRTMLESQPSIDQFLLFDEKKEHRPFFARLRFARLLRERQFDQVFLFHRSRTRAFLAWLSGIPIRIGYGKGRRVFLTSPIKEPERPLHQVDFFVELLVRAGFERPSEARYDFHFSKTEKERVEARLAHENVSRFVCFHLGANWEPKRWPPGHFALLADKIAGAWGLAVILTGGPNDLPLAESVLKHSKLAKVISWVGKTTLGELGALFERSSFVVSGDSGPMHIASGVGAKVVALFGPTNPQLTGPRGTGESLILSYVPKGYSVPWYGKELPPEGWLSRLTPEEVFQGILERGWPEPSRREKAGYEKLIRSTVAERQNILLVTLSNIGDVILTTPVIMNLRSHYPDCRLTVICGPRAQGVLEKSEAIDRLIVYDKKAGWLQKLRFILELRKDAYECVVDLRHTLIPYLVKTKKRSPLFRRFHKRSFRERHLEVLEQTGIKTSPALPPFDFFDSADMISALLKLKKEKARSENGWIAVAPAAASELKTWKLEGFREVIRRLLEKTQLEVILVGDERERKIAEPLTSLDYERVFNLAGKTSLRELAALLSRSALVLANDSAVMHLAYELGRPTVALFGPTDSERYGHEGPVFRIVRETLDCAPCSKPVCSEKQRDCFEKLDSSRVLEACLELLHV